jgi:hypothetical protein
MRDVVGAGPCDCPFAEGQTGKGNHKGLPLRRCLDFWFII